MLPGILDEEYFQIYNIRSTFWTLLAKLLLCLVLPIMGVPWCLKYTAPVLCGWISRARGALRRRMVTSRGLTDLADQTWKLSNLLHQ